MDKEIEEKMKREVAEMDRLFSDHNYSGSTEAPSTNTSSTEPPSTEVASTKAPATESASTEPPSTEAPTTEVPEDTVLKQEIESLKAELKEIKGKKEEPKTQAPTTELPIKEQDFLSEFDFEEVTSDPKAFNKLLNSIYQKAINDTKEKLSEGVLRSIPDIVRANVTTVTNLKNASEEFYKNNSDLEPFKKVVATVFEEIASENPDKEFTELLDKVADESRKRLNLHKKTVTENNNKPKPPSLPRKRGKQPRGQQPDTKGIESELAEMEKVFNS